LYTEWYIQVKRGAAIEGGASGRPAGGRAGESVNCI